jgi:hypothetical protein
MVNNFDNFNSNSPLLFNYKIVNYSNDIFHSIDFGCVSQNQSCFYDMMRAVRNLSGQKVSNPESLTYLKKDSTFTFLSY